MVICEESTIQIPGFTLAVKIWNPEQTKPVLCLHGKMDNAASFDFLAPLLPDYKIVAVDFPGTGFSSHYPVGVLPHWKNDAFLLLHLLKTFQWQQFDIIAHSLGALAAATLAMIKSQHVRKMVLLDILGPTVNFIEQANNYLQQDVETYLSSAQHSRTLFPDEDTAIKKRMQTGNISYQAAKALAARGTKKQDDGVIWTFDPRLRCVGTTLPHEDELRAMLKAVTAPVCFVRAKNGVPYPKDIFEARAKCIQHLEIHEVEGGHHVHMDNPGPVAEIISPFLRK